MRRPLVALFDRPVNRCFLVQPSLRKKSDQCVRIGTLALLQPAGRCSRKGLLIHLAAGAWNSFKCVNLPDRRICYAQTMDRRGLVIAGLACGLSSAVSRAEAAGAKPKAKSTVNNAARRITASSHYTPAPGLNSGVLVGGRFSGIIQVDAGIEIPNEADQARAEKMGPRLRDQLRAAVADYAALHYRAFDVPDPTRLKVLLQAAVDKTLGANKGKVYLASLMITRS